MMSDIFAPWRRFWGLPWLWKGPILGGAGLVVLVAVIVVASGGGDDGTGSAAGEKATRTSPTATASTSPGPGASPSATPSMEEATPAPEATEPVEPPPSEGELPGVVTPPPALYDGGGMPGPGPQPSPPPPPPPGLSEEDLATLYQFDYCDEAWWRAARLEIQLGLMAKIEGSDVTRIQEELQAVTDYLNQNCAGIGAKAGAIPGIGASRCESVKSSANMVMFWGEMVRYLGGGPSIEFAKRELEEFQAAAGCPP